MTTLILKPGREKSLRQRHPWIFSGAVDRLKGEAGPGDTIDVCSADGEWLGRAAYSPTSKITARVWTFDPDESVDLDFFRRRLENAFSLRQAVISPGETDAYRLVHGESDGLPGVIADRYSSLVVIQILSAGAERWREELTGLLAELSGVETVFERSDVDVRALEGFSERTGLVWGREPDGPLNIHENGLVFKVDVRAGQKTGFYLDQRRNRRQVGEMVRGRRVLNCFCYTGAFSIYALAGGAGQVTSVDSSAEALLSARENFQLNGFDPQQSEWVEADVFHYLRKLRDKNESFDAIILDPPKFAPTAAQAERAARGYKDINLLAFKLLRPGGLLATFSCSGGINTDLFQKIVAGAALDAGVQARIVSHFSQGADHPVDLTFPEGTYLKGLACIIT